jgi:uncharacterized protein (TIGR02996 family)
MTDADKFLAAIVADPDDDVPRLVFADWLEENGDGVRAEFIRLQIDLARQEHSPEVKASLEGRGVELQQVHGERWKLPNLPGVQTFHRGFVEEMKISAADFLRHADRIGRDAPVTDLWLTAAEYYTTPLAAVPWLPRLRKLKFRTDSIGGRLRDLFRPNLFAELRSLTVLNARLWAEHVATLASLADSWPKLDHLDLSGNPVGDEGFAHLAAATGLRGLRELVLRSDGIEYDYRVHGVGAAAFARSPTLTRLRVLNLAGQNVGDSGFGSLVRSENVSHIEVLDVSRNGLGEIGSEWAVEMLESPYLGRLRRLNVSGNTIHRLAADELSVWPHLRTGCVVDLRNCTMPSNALRTLRESEFRTQFRLDEGEA